MVNWLRPPNLSTNVNAARSQRHVGSGTWFINGQPFSEWKQGARKHLWLHGLPGCGKTVLSTTIVESLRQDRDRYVLVYYFDFTDSSKRALDGMARSLCFQLYTLGLDTSELLASRKFGSQPTTKDLLDILDTVLSLCEPTFLVIDAMDECEEKSKLIEWLEAFFSRENLRHVHLLATSRPEHEFLDNGPRWIGKNNFMAVNRECVDADIQSYIEARICNRGFSKWAGHESVKEQIRQNVGARADGM